MASLLGHFGVIWVTLEHFGIVLLSFLLSFLCRLDHNLGHYGTILMCVLTLFLTDFLGAFFCQNGVFCGGVSVNNLC